MEGAPGQSFDSSSMGAYAVLQLKASIPNAQQVVICPAGKLARLRPFEATDLLLMCSECSNTGFMLALAHVPVADDTVAAARAENSIVPGQAAYTIGVSSQLSDLLASAKRGTSNRCHNSCRLGSNSLNSNPTAQRQTT